MDKKPILLTGLPRSGTTWIGEIIRSDPSIKYYYEPDNEKVNSYAIHFKESVHRFPYRVTEIEKDKFYQLWDCVLSGKVKKRINMLLFLLMYKKRVPDIEMQIGLKTGYSYSDISMKDVCEDRWRSPFIFSHNPVLSLLSKFVVQELPNINRKQVLVKSVHSPLCLKWIDIHFSPKIVVVLRNPFALYASYKRQSMPDAFRNMLCQKDFHLYVRDNLGVNSEPIGGFEEEAIFQILIVYKFISNQLEENKHWHFVSHDKLCFNALEQFQYLYNNLGIDLGEDAIKKIDLLNTNNISGDGFVPKRVSKEQPSKWKKELSKKEIALIEYWINKLGLNGFLEEYVYDDSL